MIAINDTWKRLPLVRYEERTKRREHANEVRAAAQVLDSSGEQDRHENGDKVVAGLRTQNGPQFFVLWQIIGCVSAYDAFLAMKYRNELWQMEQNLLGRLLLFINDGDPSIFLGVKFLGTTMALGILASLYHSQPKRGIVIAKGVAGFQMLLAAYLTWG
jgi:hypothetical protein